MKKFSIRFSLFFTAYCLLPTAVALACPLCQEALFSPGQAATQSATWNAYALSIATLILVPALLVGGFVAWVVRAARLHRRRQASMR